MAVRFAIGTACEDFGEEKDAALTNLRKNLVAKFETEKLGTTEAATCSDEGRFSVEKSNAMDETLKIARSELEVEKEAGLSHTRDEFCEQLEKAKEKARADSKIILDEARRSSEAAKTKMVRDTANKIRLELETSRQQLIDAALRERF